jgi:hypothetical protein
MALTAKQHTFIECYVQHWNASRAAREAGYSEKTAGQQGYENLKKPEIAREIEARIIALLPRGELIERMAARSRSTLADVIRIHDDPPTPPKDAAAQPENEADEEDVAQTERRARRTWRGDTLWSLDLIKAQKTGGIHQIKKLKEGKYGPEIEMFDSLPAWELAGKFLKFLQDGSGILKYLDVSKLSKAQLQQLADGEDPIAVLLATSADPGESGAGAA